MLPSEQGQARDDRRCPDQDHGSPFRLPPGHAPGRVQRRRGTGSMRPALRRRLGRRGPSSHHSALRRRLRNVSCCWGSRAEVAGPKQTRYCGCGLATGCRWRLRPRRGGGEPTWGRWRGRLGVAMVPERWPCHGGKRHRGRAFTSAVATAAVNCAAVTTRTLRAMGEGGESSAVTGTSSYVGALRIK